MVSMSAKTAPTTAAVAVTSMVPPEGIVTEAGRIHCWFNVSMATPFVMTVPAVPPTETVTVEKEGTLRERPLIFTFRESPTPWAVVGEKEL